MKWLKFLHSMGLTNLSDEQVSQYTRSLHLHTARELGKLTPTQRYLYSVEKKEEILNINARLMSDNSRLSQWNKSMRVTGALCVIAMGVGTALISTFANQQGESVCFGIGWGLVIIGGSLQLIKSLLSV